MQPCLSSVESGRGLLGTYVPERILGASTSSLPRWRRIRGSSGTDAMDGMSQTKPPTLGLVLNGILVGA